MLGLTWVKGAMCSFREEISEFQNVYIINKVMKNGPNKWINKLFSYQNKLPGTLFETWKVAGSAAHKVK